MGGWMNCGTLGGGFGSGLSSFGLVGGLIGLLFNLVVIVGIVLLVIWAVRQFSSNRHSSGLFGQQNNRTAETTPSKIAEERYARGEITREEYQEILSVLS